MASMDEVIARLARAKVRLYAPAFLIEKLCEQGCITGCQIPPLSAFREVSYLHCAACCATLSRVMPRCHRILSILLPLNQKERPDIVEMEPHMHGR
jgi:hypothetical protein